MKIQALVIGILISALTGSVFANSNTPSTLVSRLNGNTLVCKSGNREFGRITSTKSGIQISKNFCWGGSEVSVELTRSFVMITCGDDGAQTTTLNLNQPLTKDSEPVDGTTYTNISAGYPYKDGLVQYLTCHAE